MTKSESVCYICGRNINTKEEKAEKEEARVFICESCEDSIDKNIAITCEKCCKNISQKDNGENNNFFDFISTKLFFTSSMKRHLVLDRTLPENSDPEYYAGTVIKYSDCDKCPPKEGNKDDEVRITVIKIGRPKQPADTKTHRSQY